MAYSHFRLYAFRACLKCLAIMTFPRPFRRRPSPWQIAWRRSPERMREHLNRLNGARTAKSDERAALVQAVFNLLPTDPMPPYELRDRLLTEWSRCYDEAIDKKAAWNLVRLGMRKGMVGRDENGLIYPRHR